MALPQRRGQRIERKAYHGCDLPAGQPFRPKKESPVERLILGLPDMAVSKVVSLSPCVLEVHWEGENRCPHCGGTELRTKDSFWREIKSYRVAVNPVRLRIRCHKFRCERCGHYFNTRLPGVRPWNRSTELLKKNVFLEYNKGPRRINFQGVILRNYRIFQVFKIQNTHKNTHIPKIFCWTLKQPAGLWTRQSVFCAGRKLRCKVSARHRLPL